MEQMLAKADQRMDMLAEITGNQRPRGQQPPLVADPPTIVSGVVEDERTILIKIKFEIYPISIEVLNKVFSACGVLESVEKFSPGDDFHSKVCFQDYDSAIRALDWYNGRCIYDRCCEIELFQASQVRDRLSQVEVPTQQIPEIFTIQDISDRSSKFEVGIGGSEAELVNKDEAELGQIKEITTPIKMSTRLSDGSRSWSTVKMEDIDPSNTVPGKYFEVPNPTAKFELSGLEINKSVEEPHTQQHRSQVKSEPSEFIIYGNANQALSKLVKLLIELMEIRVTNSKEVSWTDVRLKSVDCVTKAYKIFVKMPKRKFRVVTRVVVEDCCSYLHRLGSKASITYPFDRGRSSIELDVLIEKCFSFIFDPGGVCLRDTCQTMDKAILVFDPGGLGIQGQQIMEGYVKGHGV